MVRWLAQGAGAVLIVVALADVFLTVLYARSGIGLISHRLSRWNWRLFRRLASLFPEKSRGAVLTFGGPALLVWMAAAWFFTLVLGFALVFWPMLGESIVGPPQARTQTDFVTAL